MSSIYESAEDYLERILMLHNANGHVRAVDLANDMNFSKPSISIALKKLKERQLVIVDDETGFITLTPAGRKIASKIYERHLVLTETLISLGVSPENARMDACKIEHDLSDETFDIIKAHYLKYKKDESSH